MSNFPFLRERIVDPSTGVPLNGARLYTYEPGSTTPLAAYTTAARDVAHNNPIESDANGLLPEIYLARSTPYRFILKKSAADGGATLYDVDDISPTSLDTEFGDEFYETSENPNHYGAIGDGTADETTEVQAALNAAAANSRTGVVDLMGRTYRCDSALTWPSGVKIRNGKLSFANCNADDFVVAQGSIANAVNVTGNITEGDLSFTVSSISGLSAGDLLHLYESGGVTAGELVRIYSASVLTVTLLSSAHDGYTTANTAQIKKLTPHTGLVMEDVVIVGNASASGTGNALTLQRCKGAVLRNVEIRTVKGDAVTLKMCAETTVDGCLFRDTTGGAVIVRDACIDTTISGCKTDRVAAATVGVFSVGQNSTSGVCYRTTIAGCQVSGCGRAVRAYDLSRFVEVRDCIIDGGTEGVYTSGRDVSVQGCTLYNFTWTIWVTSDATLATTDYSRPRRLSIRNNYLSAGGGSPSSGVRLNMGTGYAYESIDISGNEFYAEANTTHFVLIVFGGSTSTTVRSLTIDNNRTNFSGTGDFIEVQHSASSGSPVYTIDMLTMRGNTKEAGTDFIDIAPTSGTLNITSAVITGNAVDGSILVESNGGAYSRVVIADNAINVSSGTYGVRVNDVADLTISGNAIASVTTNGIYVDSASDASDQKRVTITGNTVGGVTGTNAIGIGVFDYDVVSITGNAVGETGSAIDFGIRVSSLDRDTDSVSISGNTISGIADTANNAAIHVIGDSGQRAGNVSIVGNSAVVVSENVYGVFVDAYADNLTIANNTIEHLSATGSNAGIYVNGSASGAILGASITGNFVTCGELGIKVNGHLSSGTISSNTIRCGVASGVGISVAGAAAGNVHDLAISGNAVVGGASAGGIGISVVNTEEFAVSGNTVNAYNGIFVDECDSIHVAANRLDCANLGIEVDNTSLEFTSCCISGNQIVATGVGIEVDASDATGSNGLVISGNSIKTGAAFTIEVTGIITGIAITGNACRRGSDAAANIQIAGDAAGNITQCVVVGNALQEGTYGINISNNATSYHSANSFSSMATGNTNGTFVAVIAS